MEGEKRIERYQFSLKHELGRGSYATVYLGHNLDNQTEVAVKMLDKRIFLNSYNLRNIQSEISIMKKVNHENIVSLFDIYQTNNNMYIITELCEGGDLMSYLQKRKRLPESEAKLFLRQIMAGIEYLHKQGIIHRDLKPANILLHNKMCKISDFGFAKNIDGNETVMKSVVGTPLYMSPQLLERTKYTNKSDIWSVGLIYYEMLHGRTPWVAQNELQLINQIRVKKPTFSSWVSADSRNFIERCLKISEDDRIGWEEAFKHPLLNDGLAEKDYSSERVEAPVSALPVKLDYRISKLPNQKENRSPSPLPALRNLRSETNLHGDQLNKENSEIQPRVRAQLNTLAFKETKLKNRTPDILRDQSLSGRSQRAQNHDLSVGGRTVKKLSKIQTLTPKHRRA